MNVSGPQPHEDIAEISGNVASSGGPLRKSARLPANGPEVFEFESGSGSSLLPRRRRWHRTSGLEAKGEVSPLRKSARRCPEVFEIACRSGSSPQLLPALGDLLPGSGEHLRMRRCPRYTRSLAAGSKGRRIYFSNYVKKMRWRSTGNRTKSNVR